MEAQQYNAPINAQCWEAWTKDLNNKRRIPPTISLTAAESTTQVNTMNTIKTYILEKVTKIICGDDSIDNWDELRRDAAHLRHRRRYRDTAGGFRSLSGTLIQKN